jgi:hypothetical protein
MGLRDSRRAVGASCVPKPLQGARLRPRNDAGVDLRGLYRRGVSTTRIHFSLQKWPQPAAMAVSRLHPPIPYKG